jgi:hypothetical protein
MVIAALHDEHAAFPEHDLTGTACPVVNAIEARHGSLGYRWRAQPNVQGIVIADDPHRPRGDLDG